MLFFIAGTQSGKSTLFLKSLQNVEANFNPPPSCVYFLFQCHQSAYLETKQNLLKQGVKAIFTEGDKISLDEIKQISKSNEGQTIIAIDDATLSTTKNEEIAQIFTVCRHFNISLTLFWHVLFPSTPEARIISQNTAYYFLLGAPRIGHQVATLGSQIQLRNVLVSAFQQATEVRYGYLLVDLRVGIPNLLRIRSKVFSEEKEDASSIIRVCEVYVPKHD